MREGGYLVSINDRAENTFVIEQFIEAVPIDPSLNDTDQDQLYIGLSTDSCSDVNCRSGWKCEDGTILKEFKLCFLGK